jgi:hypothetical protein
MPKKIINEVSYGETFIDPFLRVFKLMAVEAKKSLITLKTMIWVIFTPFPGMIRKQMDVYDNTMEKIDRENADLYRAINDSFKGGDADILGMFFAPGPWALAILGDKASDAVDNVTDLVVDIADPEGKIREKLKKNRYAIEPSELAAYSALGIIATNKDENGNELPGGKYRVKDNWFSKKIFQYNDENRYDTEREPGDRDNLEGAEGSVLQNMQILFYGKKLNESVLKIINEDKNQEVEPSDEEKLKQLMSIYAKLKSESFNEQKIAIVSSIEKTAESVRSRKKESEELFEPFLTSKNLKELENSINSMPEDSEDKKKIKIYWQNFLKSIKEQESKIKQPGVLDKFKNLIKFGKAKKQQELNKEKIEEIEVTQKEIDETSETMIFNNAKKQIDELKKEKLLELNGEFSKLFSGESELSEKSVIPSDKIIEIISTEDKKLANFLSEIKEEFGVKN